MYVLGLISLERHLHVDSNLYCVYIYVHIVKKNAMEQNIIIDIPCAHTHIHRHTHTNIEKTKAVVKANSNLLEISQWRYKLESAGMWLGLASGVLLGYFVSNHMQPPAPRYCGCFF